MNKEELRDKLLAAYSRAEGEYHKAQDAYNFAGPCVDPYEIRMYEGECEAYANALKLLEDLV